MFDEYAGQRGEQFDLIFLSMVLEHIVDLMQFIKACNRMCSRYMFIEIPTLDLRCEEEPMGIFCEEHVSLFTLDSLSNMMTAVGYRLVNVENIYGLGRYLPAGYPAIATIWEKELGLNPYTFRYNMFSTEECLDKYIQESKLGLEQLKQKIDRIPDDSNTLWRSIRGS